MGAAELSMLIPIVSVISAIVMIIYLRRYENQERMAMIEKGVSPDLFAKRQRSASSTLRFALLFIGAGVGLLLGYFLDSAFRMDEVAYFSMLFIFGGLGLGAAYMIEEKKLRS
jgi:F0F1-type ATP synthase assembly protein I